LFVELRHLRYFIKSAELLHFTEAAAALHVSQPNLSLQIQQLEEELGSQLFERIGRAVHLTAAGELFLEYAQRALREVEAGQQSIQDLKGLLLRTLRIGIGNSFSAELFPRLLAEFVRAHPEIHVSVSLATNRCIEAGVRNGDLDLGLIYQPPKPVDFNYRELFREPLVVVVSRNHHLVRSESLRIRDLEDVPLALPTSDLSTRQLMDSAFAAAQIEPNIIVEANDVDVLLGLAEQGVAATILNSEATRHLPAGCVSRIRLNEKGFLLTATFIWSQVTGIHPVAARFLESAACSRATGLRRPREAKRKKDTWYPEAG
jgi:LysR family cyn operon transcriptional activator